MVSPRRALAAIFPGVAGLPLTGLPIADFDGGGGGERLRLSNIVLLPTLLNANAARNAISNACTWSSSPRRMSPLVTSP